MWELEALFVLRSQILKPELQHVLLSSLGKQAPPPLPSEFHSAGGPLSELLFKIPPEPESVQAPRWVSVLHQAEPRIVSSSPELDGMDLGIHGENPNSILKPCSWLPQASERLQSCVDICFSLSQKPGINTAGFIPNWVYSSKLMDSRKLPLPSCCGIGRPIGMGNSRVLGLPQVKKQNNLTKLGPIRPRQSRFGKCLTRVGLPTNKGFWVLLNAKVSWQPGVCS